MSKLERSETLTIGDGGGIWKCDSETCCLKQAGPMGNQRGNHLTGDKSLRKDGVFVKKTVTIYWRITNDATADAGEGANCLAKSDLSKTEGDVRFLKGKASLFQKAQIFLLSERRGN